MDNRECRQGTFCAHARCQLVRCAWPQLSQLVDTTSQRPVLSGRVKSRPCSQHTYTIAEPWLLAYQFLATDEAPAQIRSIANHTLQSVLPMPHASTAWTWSLSSSFLIFIPIWEARIGHAVTISWKKCETYFCIFVAFHQPARTRLWCIRRMCTSFPWPVVHRSDAPAHSGLRAKIPHKDHPESKVNNSVWIEQGGITGNPGSWCSFWEIAYPEEFPTESFSPNPHDQAAGSQGMIPLKVKQAPVESMAQGVSLW